MKSSARAATLILVLFLTACNLPGTQTSSGPSVEDQAATLVAATMQAISTSAPSGVTPFVSPVAPVLTPTAKPTFLINTNNASCRSGPAADSELIAKFAAGTTVDLAGKDTADSYYVVVDPGTHNLCWIEAQDGTPGGSFSLLPEVTPQPGTQNVKVPAKPGALFYSFTCLGGGQVKVDLRWSDTANNETGYRIYRDGTQITDLPANSTSYSDTTTVASGTSVVYQVAAYNDAGTSPQSVTGNGDPISC
jgi:hypothetical protein